MRRPPSWAAAGRRPAGTIGACPSGPNVDLSDIDPLAPTLQGVEEARGKQIQTTETARGNAAVRRADRLGRDVLAQGHQGHRDLGLRGRAGGRGGHRASARMLGAFVGSSAARWATSWSGSYNVFESIPDILLIFAFAAALGQRHR